MKVMKSSMKKVSMKGMKLFMKTATKEEFVSK